MEKMTIFYSKNTGNIQAVFSGEVDFDVFLEREEDIKSYCLKIITNLNTEFLLNSSFYKIDLDTNNIVPKLNLIRI